MAMRKMLFVCVCVRAEDFLVIRKPNAACSTCNYGPFTECKWILITGQKALMLFSHHRWRNDTTGSPTLHFSHEANQGSTKILYTCGFSREYFVSRNIHHWLWTHESHCVFLLLKYHLVATLVIVHDCYWQNLLAEGMSMNTKLDFLTWTMLWLLAGHFLSWWPQKCSALMVEVRMLLFVRQQHWPTNGSMTKRESSKHWFHTQPSCPKAYLQNYEEIDGRRSRTKQNCNTKLILLVPLGPILGVHPRFFKPKSRCAEETSSVSVSEWREQSTETLNILGVKIDLQQTMTGLTFLELSHLHIWHAQECFSRVITTFKQLWSNSTNLIHFAEFSCMRLEWYFLSTLQIVRLWELSRVISFLCPSFETQITSASWKRMSAESLRPEIALLALFVVAPEEMAKSIFSSHSTCAD